MKYFIVEQKKGLPNIPDLLNWYKKINVEVMNTEGYLKIPRHVTLYARRDPNIEFYDILGFPFFMVNEKVYKVMKCFEPNLLVREIDIFELEHNKVGRYFAPILKRFSDITKDVEEKLRVKNYKDITLELAKGMDNYIFLIESYGKKKIVMRLELVEALLRRKIRGIELHEIKVS